MGSKVYLLVLSLVYSVTGGIHRKIHRFEGYLVHFDDNIPQGKGSFGGGTFQRVGAAWAYFQLRVRKGTHSTYAHFVWVIDQDVPGTIRGTPCQVELG